MQIAVVPSAESTLLQRFFWLRKNRSRLANSVAIEARGSRTREYPAPRPLHPSHADR